MDVIELALESRLTLNDSLESNRWEASVWGNGYCPRVGSDKGVPAISTRRVDEDEDMLSESVKASRRSSLLMGNSGSRAKQLEIFSIREVSKTFKKLQE